MPTRELPGPLLAQCAQTMGKGRVDLAMTHTDVPYIQCEGAHLDTFTLQFLQENTTGDGPLGSGVSILSRRRWRQLDATAAWRAPN